MLSIYFEDRAIHFASAQPHDAPGERIDPQDGLDIAKVLQKFGNRNTVWIISPDYDACFERFCALFDRVQAAGGVTRDEHGRILLIRRNGRWDLPKGHLETDESYEQCARRETGEECGITGVEAGEFLCLTRHAYLWQERWTLKECRWYRLRCEGCGEPEPQAEEGIEAALWMSPEEADRALETSYATIRHVIKQYKR